MLFDNRDRVDRRPSTTETPFEFLDRAGGDYWAQVRAALNLWFDRYPQEHRGELRERLFSDEQFDAFWELLLHALYSDAGFRVEVHPEIEGSGRRPDFRVTGRTGEFLLEARAVSAVSAEKRRRDRRLNTLIETLNRVQPMDFYLKLTLVSEGRDQPAVAPVIADLMPWLGTLDPDQIHQQASLGGLQGLPSREIKTGSWTLRFTPVPVDPDKRGLLAGPLIGLGPVETTVSDPTAAMRRALSQKGRHYGSTETPLVLALALEEMGIEDGDVAAVLFGRVAAFLSSEGDVIEQRRLDDGYWSGRRNAGLRVSAVVTVRNPRPWNITGLELRLWLNPWSPNPYPADRLWKWTTVDPTSGEFEHGPASTSTFELLGLPLHWPTGAPFP